MKKSNVKSLFGSQALYKIILGLAVLLLAFITAISYRQIKNLQVSADMVSHSLIVDREINALFSYYNRLESNELRNIISSDTNVNPAYSHYRKLSEQSFEKLTALTDGIQEHSQYLDSVAILKTRLFNTLDSLQQSRFPDTTVNRAAAMQVRRIDDIMNSIRAYKTKMVIKKDELLAERMAAYKSQSYLTPLTSLFLALFSLIVFLISFRKISQGRLQIKKTENLLENILQNTDNIINYYEPIYDLRGRVRDFKVVFANECNRIYMGMDPEYMIGKPISKLFPFLLLNGELEKIVEGYKQQRTVSFNRKLSANGQSMWFHSIVKPIANGMVVVARNNTDEKKAEEQMRSLNQELKQKNQDLDDTRRLLQIILETTDNIVHHYQAIYDDQGRVADFRILYATENIREYVDLGPDDVIGRKISEIYPFIESTGSLQMLIEAMESGSKKITERKLNFKGKDIWFRLVLEPVEDRITSTATNITSAKQAEKHLLELNDQLRIQNSILNDAEGMAQIGSYLWKVEDGNLEISSNLYAMLGCQNGEFEPTLDNYMEFVYPDDKKKVSQYQTIARNRMQPGELTYRVITKHGAVKHLKTSGHFIQRNGDTVMIGVAQDVSERIKSEQKLINRNRQLKQTNAELESFNRVASHDLQEPLRKIQMFISRITDKDKLSENSAAYFEKITQAADRMQTLIKNLLTYSRIDSTLDKLEDVDLNEVIQIIKDNLSVQIKEVDMNIVCQKLPVISGVPYQMEQLFANLISNAIKYRDPMDTPKVVIEAYKIEADKIEIPFHKYSDTYHKITFSDNGIGFEQENAEKIFEIFQRLHSRSEYSGTGIGLAICKKIVENHHGFIHAISKPGNGSSFIIYLPV